VGRRVEERASARRMLGGCDVERGVQREEGCGYFVREGVCM